MRLWEVVSRVGVGDQCKAVENARVATRELSRRRVERDAVQIFIEEFAVGSIAREEGA